MRTLKLAFPAVLFAVVLGGTAFAADNMSSTSNMSAPAANNTSTTAPAANNATTTAPAANNATTTAPKKHKKHKTTGAAAGNNMAAPENNATAPK